MPSITAAYPAYRSAFLNLATELSFNECADDTKQALAAYWDDPNNEESLWGRLALVLNTREGDLLGQVSSKYKCAYMRGVLLPNQDTLKLYAYYQGATPPKDWLPVYTNGSCLTFCHFLPNIPRPAVPEYCSQFILVSYANYADLRSKLETVQWGNFAELVTTRNPHADPKTPQQVLEAWTANPLLQPETKAQLKAIYIDPYLGLSQLETRLPDPFKALITFKNAQKDMGLFASQDGSPHMIVVDPKCLLLTRNELEFPPMMAGGENWLDPPKLLPLAVQGQYILLGSPLALELETRGHAVNKLLGWQVSFAWISESHYQDVQKQWKRTIAPVGKDVESVTVGELEIKAQDSSDEREPEWANTFVRNMLALGVSKSASDIHIEPHGDSFVVRMRIDGFLRNVSKPLPLAHIDRIINRIKILSHIKIEEKRKGQDGKFRIAYHGRTIDIRCAISPVEVGLGDTTKQHEFAVLRLLDSQTAPSTLDSVFQNAEQAAQIRNIINSPTGIFVITGPTGAGKSTTLYSLLAEINQPDIKLITIEDPVERRILGVNQIQVSEANSFAEALRIILRCDPDAILVGEVRDAETAQHCVRASQTGHFVLTTAHSNNAVAAIPYFQQLGVSRWDLGDVLLGVTAQRLCRTLCPSCRSVRKLTPLESSYFRRYGDAHLTEPPQIVAAKGCALCDNSGYLSRLAIMEVLSNTPSVREAIEQGGSTQAIFQAARTDGFKPLFYYGLKMAAQGLTDIRELKIQLPEYAAFSNFKAPSQGG